MTKIQLKVCEKTAQKQAKKSIKKSIKQIKTLSSDTNNSNKDNEAQLDLKENKTSRDAISNDGSQAEDGEKITQILLERLQAEEFQRQQELIQ